MRAQHQSIVDNLERSARLYPDRCAIEEPGRSITYADLWKQSQRFAAALAQRGLCAGDRLAVALPNSIDFVIGYYGVLLAGGVGVLLNVAAKSRDLITWLRDCEARFVLADPVNPELMTALKGLDSPPTLVSMAEAREALGMESSTTHSRQSSGDLACILYTSGTTGRPKGVMLSHGNLLSNTAAIVEYLDLTCDDSVVTVLPFYYSYGSSVLHTHVQAGAKLVLENNLVYPHAVVETLAKRRATGFAGVPSTFAILLSRVNLREFDLSALRYVTQAGGAMTPALTQRLLQALPGVALIVMYGQTEATARLTYLPAQKLSEKLGSVGIPVAGVTIEIRDETGQPLKAGDVGEIWATGPNIMLGYWRNQSATDEVKRDGWLVTGDMGRLDSEGFLYIAGRRSDIIKAGAHRIHPQDVEEVIAELQGVQEVAVVGADDALLGEVVKAFVVPSSGAELTPMQVQAHCRDRLANYKVPKFIEFVAGLPRTATGKVCRAELIERSR